MEKRILLTGKEGLSLVFDESDLYTRKIQIGGEPIEGFEQYKLSGECPSHLDVIRINDRIISYLGDRGTPIPRKQPQLEEIDRQGLGNNADQLHRADSTYDIGGLTFNLTRCYTSAEWSREPYRYTRVVASCLKGSDKSSELDEIVMELLDYLKGYIAKRK